MKTIRISPVANFLDLRSNPEDLGQSNYRWVLNWEVQQKLRLCRSSGWSRLLDRDEGWSNADLHSQLQDITGNERRAPITMLFEAQSLSKSKILLAANDRTVFALLVGTQNWRVLNTTALGEDDVTRFYATQNEETVVLTNDMDPPKAWVFDGTELDEIADLTTLGITRVGFVTTWNGVTLYMNYVKDGTAYPHGIIWSDLKKPLSLIESEESIAFSLELDSDESILTALPLGNVLIIYTTKKIWEMSFLGGDGSENNPTFGVAKRYTPQSGESCLAYKNTLVSTGDEHLYASHEGIYSYSLFKAEPTLVEWINRASSYIYDTLDRSLCDWFIAKYNPERREVMFSWINEGEDLPSSTLVINKLFPFSNVVDHGFTAFGIFQPNEPVTPLSQWILDQCICDSEEYAEVFGQPENEGGPCEEPDAVTCDDPPDSFFTTVTQELEDGIVMEDWNEAEPSENSLCNRLAGTTISSLCVDESRRDQCNSGRYFVMASADDLCLKQLTDSFYRQVCTNFTGCGTYTIVGYKSILRTGPLAFKDVANNKQIDKILVEAIAAVAVVPGRMRLRVGTSSMSLDPNLEDCGIVWFEENPVTLDCIAGATSDHEEDNTRPDEELSFPAHVIGKWIYLEFTVENAASTPIDTGAAICISSFVAEVGSVQKRY